MQRFSLSARGRQDAYSLCGKLSCGSTIKVLEPPMYGDIQEVLELPTLLRENPSSPLGRSLISYLKGKDFNASLTKAVVAAPSRRRGLRVK